MSNKVKGGRKLARSAKDKGYYTQQFVVTARNKLRRATKRKKKKEYWDTLNILGAEHGQL